MWISILLGKVVLVIILLLCTLTFSIFNSKANTLSNSMKSISFPDSSDDILRQSATVESSNLSGLTTNDNYSIIAKENMIFGAYVPNGFYLEKRHGNDQTQAISNFLKRGFDDYYFVMSDFRNLKEVNSTEALLTSADKTELKINIILLPPSEAGPKGNYDWNGWIDYFNTLKSKHSSFKGFAMDDLNWADIVKGERFVRNIDFMIYSKLSKALEHKRNDVEFYPVVYFEGSRTDEIVNQYTKFAHGVILVSANYYNVSKLEKDLLEFKGLFRDKSIYFFIYPTVTLFYGAQRYDQPSDRLLMATLSIASRIANGIIIWHNIDNHVVRDFIQNWKNTEYIEAIHVMEKLQITDEQRIAAY
jgi:hypothetical protein